jgi:hypothetical protein
MITLMFPIYRNETHNFSTTEMKGMKLQVDLENEGLLKVQWAPDPSQNVGLFCRNSRVCLFYYCSPTGLKAVPGFVPVMGHSKCVNEIVSFGF